jgi:hypothetical protein
MSTRAQDCGMSIEEACRAILGNSLAEAIADDMGWHWAAVAAMADPTAVDHPAALTRLRERAREHHAKSGQAGRLA